MGRSRIMGKMVKELTASELLAEKQRCENFIKAIETGPAVKGLKKRLHEIDKRLEREANEQDDA